MLTSLRAWLAVEGAGARRRYLGFFVLAVLAAVAACVASGNQLRFHDERDYVELAQRLVEGRGYVLPDGTPTALRPPGYPFLLVPLLALVNQPLAVKLLNVVFLAGFIVLLHRLIRRDTPGTAWMAPLLVLGYPLLTYTVGTAYPQMLCTLLLLAILFMLIHVSSWRALVGAGLLYGGLMLVSPSFQLLAPLFAIGPWLHRTSVTTRLARIAVFYLAAACVVAPWVARNVVVMDALVPVSTNGGNNLLLGNSPNTTANSGTDVDLSAQYTIGDRLGEIEQNRYYQREALAWMKAHPAETLRLYVKKLANYFNYEANVRSPGTGVSWQSLMIAATYYPLLLIAVLRLAFWRRVPLSNTEIVLYAFYFLNALAAAIFFTRVRFRIPFDGLLMALAAIALGHWAAWRRGVRPGINP